MDIELLRGAGRFKSSAVGAADKRRQELSVRSSESCPLFPPPPPALGYGDARRRLYDVVDALGACLDSPGRPLYQPLDLELGYLHYPPGGYYQRHFDVPAHEVVDGRGRLVSFERRVSFLIYLNENWAGNGYGGELRIHTPLDATEAAHRKHVGGPEISENPVRSVLDDVEPEGGTLVCFHSDAVEHEVLATTRERQVIVGWLRGAAPPCVPGLS